MIIENAFIAEIQLENGDINDFVDKAWKALNIDKAYPEEKIGNNAFMDWAKDLYWIKEKEIIVIIKGKIQDDAKRIIEVLDKYWDAIYDSEEEKNVSFIITNG